MVPIKEAWERLGLSRPEAWQVYRENLHPGETVVVIGPSPSLRRDPTSLVAADLVGKAGQVYLADPLFTADDRRLEAQGGRIYPEGGVGLLLHELNLLRDFGLPLAPVDWLGAESGVLNIPLLAASVDAVVDHHTSAYLADWEAYRTKEAFQPQEFFTAVFREAARVLKSRGRLIWQTDLDDAAERQLILGAAAAAGIGGNFQKVQDRFRIPLTFDQYQHLMIHELAARAGENLNFVPHLQPGYALVFEILDWRSPDLFLGIKTV